MGSAEAVASGASTIERQRDCLVSQPHEKSFHFASQYCDRIPANLTYEMMVFYIPSAPNLDVLIIQFI